MKGNTVFTARMYEPKAEKTSILVVNLDKQGPSACSIVSPLALRRYVTEQNKFMWKESLKKKKTQKDAESQWGGGGLIFFKLGLKFWISIFFGVFFGVFRKNNIFFCGMLIIFLIGEGGGGHSGVSFKVNVQNVNICGEC